MPSSQQYYILATLLAVFSVTMSANLEVPLFRIYALNAHQGTGITALVFAVYVGGMIPVLIFFGGLSDVIGRRNVLLLAQCCVLISELLITFSPNLSTLFITRFFAGMGVAFTIGTATALLNQIYVHPQKENIVAAWVGAASTLGFGVGPFLTGYAVLQSELDLSPFSYKFALTLVLCSLVNTAFLPNLKLAGNKQIIRTPYFHRHAWIYNFSIFSCWTTTAFIIAILPTQLSQMKLLGHTGNLVCITLLSGFVSIQLFKKWTEYKSVCLSYLFPLLGISFVIIGLHYSQILLCFFGASMSGIAAWGLMYKNGMAAVSKLSGNAKARGVSGFILTGYIGFSVPIIFVGYAVDTFGFFFSVYTYAILLLVFNSILLILYRQQSKRLQAQFHTL